MGVRDILGCEFSADRSPPYKVRLKGLWVPTVYRLVTRRSSEPVCSVKPWIDTKTTPPEPQPCTDTELVHAHIRCGVAVVPEESASRVWVESCGAAYCMIRRS